MRLTAQMKPTPNSPADRPTLLAFGAHPDDIEFGCGGIIARETQSGRAAHLVVCSRGEAGTNGTPAIRTKESKTAAALLGARLEFLTLDGDAHLEIKVSHTLKLAGIIRRLRPSVVLAPTLVENQHPDHYRLGKMVRDAARLARYGGVRELMALPRHAISHLLYYAVTADAEPSPAAPVLIDVSIPDILTAWTASMQAHASQLKTRNYVDLQLARATLNGSRCGAAAAIPLWPNDPLCFNSLADLDRSARRF
jgi:LmbE family N-acetylglucosaminyl deacetylase